MPASSCQCDEIASGGIESRIIIMLLILCICVVLLLLPPVEPAPPTLLLIAIIIGGRDVLVRCSACSLSCACRFASSAACFLHTMNKKRVSCASLARNLREIRHRNVAVENRSLLFLHSLLRLDLRILDLGQAFGVQLRRVGLIPVRLPIAVSSLLAYSRDSLYLFDVTVPMEVVGCY
eukprot:408243-Rhodomonas_salina.2